MNELAEKINDDILKVVEYYDVALTKKGPKYLGKCPFHNEKTPSFYVSPAKGIFKCFGCGAAGNAIGFIQQSEKLPTRVGSDFVEILKIGAKIHNLSFEPKPLSDEEKAANAHLDSLRVQHSAAVRIYHQNLLKPKFATHYEYVRSRVVPEIPFIGELIPEEKLYKGDLDIIPTLPLQLTYEEDFRFFVETWQIGWSDEHKIVTDAAKAGLSPELLEEIGILRKAAKTSAFYDNFADRITFPIFDHYGNPIALSCRTRSAEKGIAKYKNTGDTPLFVKGDNLYGLHLAKRYIREQGQAVLVEGNLDVLRLHWLGVHNTVAALGTALTESQIRQIRQYTDNVLCIYDGDTAGLKAMHRNSPELIKAGFTVFIVLLPEERDPADFFYHPQQYSDYIEENQKDFIFYLAEEEFKAAGANIRKKQAAIEKIAELLMPLDTLTRDLYIQDLMKISSTRAKEWSGFLNARRKTEENKELAKGPRNTQGLSVEQMEMFENFHFYYTENHEMYFRDGNGMVKKSRFAIYPLFHINSSTSGVRKIFKIKNYRGDEHMLETDVSALQSTVRFCEKLEEKGAFIFEGDMKDLRRIKHYLYHYTKMANAVDVLGWQKEGFWAWADGIVGQDGKFKETDDYGIVQHNGTYYYIPAYSSLNESANEFVEQRKFVYAVQNISLREWSRRMVDVYGPQAMLSIACYMTALFSDHIFSVTRAIPILNLFGIKGSGKSDHAYSLTALFGQQMTPLMLNNTTVSRFSSHVNDYRNVMVFFDEFKNGIKPEFIGALKDLWGRNIRGRSTRNSSDRIVADHSQAVNAMAIVAGQEMLSADVALFSRVIYLSTSKTSFSDEEAARFDELKAIEKNGLAHITSGLLSSRIIFEKQYLSTFNEVQSAFKRRITTTIDERLIKNYSIILASLKLIMTEHQLSFTYQQAEDAALKQALDHNSKMKSSNEISGFFKVLSAMLERGLIKDGYNFKIKKTLALSGGVRFETATNVLFLRWEGIYQSYAEMGRKTGENVMPEESIKFYLERSDAFIDRRKSRFSGVGSVWCSAFRYAECEALGLSLLRNDSEGNADEEDGIEDPDEPATIRQGDLPFQAAPPPKQIPLDDVDF